MTEFARGGLITGPGGDPTPIFTETLLAQPCGYVLRPRVVRQLGAGFLKKLNACAPDHLERNGLAVE